MISSARSRATRPMPPRMASRGRGQVRRRAVEQDARRDAAIRAEQRAADVLLARAAQADEAERSRPRATSKVHRAASAATSPRTATRDLAGVRRCLLEHASDRARRRSADQVLGRCLADRLARRRAGRRAARRRGRRCGRSRRAGATHRSCRRRCRAGAAAPRTGARPRRPAGSPSARRAPGNRN